LEIKLKHLDEYINARRAVADFYDNAFHTHKFITTPFRAANNRHVFHQYTLLLEGIDRNALNQFLAENGIPNMIYYPVPSHRQKMFSSYNTSELKLPVTDSLTQKVISLPIHTEMEKEQLDFITSRFLEFVNR
jgi:dTDP-4-amino-4,6-dideoxygalactose transaminase